jgi:hypothetical protein
VLNFEDRDFNSAFPKSVPLHSVLKTPWQICQMFRILSVLHSNAIKIKEINRLGKCHNVIMDDVVLWNSFLFTSIVCLKSIPLEEFAARMASCFT